jgi:serine protease Do
MKLHIILVLIVLLIIGAAPNYGGGQTHRQIIKVEKKGKRGYLGVEVQDVTRKFKEKKNLSVDRGAYVQSVVEDSPAEDAGILKGDVIVKFADETVNDGEELTDAVRATKPKSEVKVEINRKGEKKTLTAVVGKIKAPQAFSFNFNDGEPGDMPDPPKITKRLNMRIFSESEMNGLQTQSLTKQLGEYFGAPNGRGVLVTEVEKGSDADKAGFKAGDVITKVAAHSIDDIDELREELSDMERKEAPFEIIRGGKSMKLTMKIEEEDSEDEDDSSGNILITPGRHSLMTPENIFSGQIHLNILKERLNHLGSKIRSNIRKIEQKTRCCMSGV